MQNKKILRSNNRIAFYQNNDNKWAAKGKCTCDDAHLSDDRRVQLGCKVQGSFSFPVLDVSASLAFLQQLLYTQQVAALACQVQWGLTRQVLHVDLTGERKNGRYDNNYYLDDRKCVSLHMKQSLRLQTTPVHTRGGLCW